MIGAPRQVQRADMDRFTSPMMLIRGAVVLYMHEIIAYTYSNVNIRLSCVCHRISVNIYIVLS